MPGLNQMSSTSSGGASVITLQFDLDLSLDIAEQEVQAAINAAGTYLPTDLPMPADLQQGQPGRRADPDAGADLGHPAAARGGGPGRYPPGAEDLAAARRRAGQHQRRPAPGRARAASIPRALAAYGLSLEDLRTATRQRQRQPAQGQLRRPAPRASTIDANDQLSSAAEYVP